MPMNANRITVRSRMPGAPNRLKKLSVCDSPSKMIDDTPKATSVTSAADQPGSSRPLPNGRGWTRPSSSTSRQWARRPRVRNQTVKVSPCDRHSSRPNWAIIARVSAVYPTSTMNSVAAPAKTTSSSQTKNAKPMTAGQRPRRSG